MGMTVEIIEKELHCPACGRPHHDQGAYREIPHNIHRCEHCFTEWRVTVVGTLAGHGVLGQGMPLISSTKEIK